MAKSDKSTIKKDKTRTTLALVHTHNAAHTSKTRSPVQHGYIPEPSSIKHTTTTAEAQRTAPSPATEANGMARRAG
jgi:hypothetical protein